MATKLKEGMRVRVRRPGNIEEFPTWVSMMERYDNSIQTVENVCWCEHEGCYVARLKDCNYYTFRESWLTIIDEETRAPTTTSKKLVYCTCSGPTRPSFIGCAGGGEWIQYCPTCEAERRQ